MKRKISQKLINWISSNRRKPLILRGARQVGKTWLVKNVLAPHFEDFVLIDFEAQRELRAIFDGDLKVRNIVRELEVLVGKKIKAQHTLLFFDEIQSCPRAIMALRYFYEEMPDIHVVAAGSMLEFAFGEISIPVGRVQYQVVYPMTFYEFLLALGHEVMAEELLVHPKHHSGLTQKAILKVLKEYFFVGGMPEAVECFRESNSLKDVFELQSDILNSYQDDFLKYTPKVDPNCLSDVFLSAARSIGNQVIYTRLSQNFSLKTNQKALGCLEKARVVHRIPSCDPSGLPLGGAANLKRVKLGFLDIGLMQRLCQVSYEIASRESNLLSLYQGQLAEQFVSQELHAWKNESLHYWSREARGSSAEVDYVTHHLGRIYPIEVKSGPAGKLRSLHMFLERYSHCPKGLVLYDGEYKEVASQRLSFMPIYSTAVIGQVNEDLSKTVEEL